MGILNLFGGKGKKERKAEKILVIDDEEPIAHALELLLTARGYEVHVALCGAEGIEIAKRELPDLIILDLMMPEMSGYDTCKMIKQDSDIHHIPILVLTAMVMSAENTEKAFQVGASGYISKPYDTVRLVEKIQKLLSDQSRTQKTK